MRRKRTGPIRDRQCFPHCIRAASNKPSVCRSQKNRDRRQNLLSRFLKTCKRHAISKVIRQMILTSGSRQSPLHYQERPENRRSPGRWSPLCRTSRRWKHPRSPSVLFHRSVFQCAGYAPCRPPKPRGRHRRRSPSSRIHPSAETPLRKLTLPTKSATNWFLGFR